MRLSIHGFMGYVKNRKTAKGHEEWQGDFPARSLPDFVTFSALHYAGTVIILPGTPVNGRLI